MRTFFIFYLHQNSNRLQIKFHGILSEFKAFLLFLKFKIAFIFESNAVFPLKFYAHSFLLFFNKKRKENWLAIEIKRYFLRLKRFTYCLVRYIIRSFQSSVKGL